jgi:hypothetical protein
MIGPDPLFMPIVPLGWGIGVLEKTGAPERVSLFIKKLFGCTGRTAWMHKEKPQTGVEIGCIARLQSINA